MMMALIMASLTMMTSCEIDNSEASNDEFRASIANTTWKMSEIKDNGSWTNPDYVSFDIPQMRFIGGDKYEMKVYNFFGSGTTITFRGNYKFDGDNIMFTDEDFGGTRFALYIIKIDKTLMESTITVWGDDHYSHDTVGTGTTITTDTETYTVRFQKI